MSWLKPRPTKIRTEIQTEIRTKIHTKDPKKIPTKIQAKFSLRFQWHASAIAGTCSDWAVGCQKL
jgi:hypothetical protein